MSRQDASLTFYRKILHKTSKPVPGATCTIVTHTVLIRADHKSSTPCTSTQLPLLWLSIHTEGLEDVSTAHFHTHPRSAHPHPQLSPCILLVQDLDVGCSQPHRNQYIKCSQNQIWRCTLIIPGHGRLRQKDCLKVKARLGCRA